MGRVNHLETFYGLKVRDFPFTEPGTKAPRLPAADAVAWRISTPPYGTGPLLDWEQVFERFADTVDLSQVRAIVVGLWTKDVSCRPDKVIETLLAARDQLPSLRALFLGDIAPEEYEISWIEQGLVSPLLEGFPELEEFGVRGGNRLEFHPVTHQRLRSLVVETGGLPAGVVRAIAASDFPALKYLELWLGTADYGGDSEIADLAPILQGTRLPRLRHLALCNSDYEDEIAAAMASAPIVAQLKTLDLSMGILTDEGATALLSGQPLTHLKTLDLDYNFLSEPVRQRFRDALEGAGVTLYLDEEAEEHEWDDEIHRFVAVGE